MMHDIECADALKEIALGLGSDGGFIYEDVFDRLCLDCKKDFMINGFKTIIRNKKGINNDTN